MDNDKLILTVSEFRRLAEIRNKSLLGKLMSALWTELGSENNGDYELITNGLLQEIQLLDLSYDSIEARDWDMIRAKDVIEGIFLNYFYRC